MCQKRKIIYFSSNESNESNDEGFDLKWPLEKGSNAKLIVACGICFYPVAFEENVISEIRDENNISFGIVIPMGKLFSRIGLRVDNPLQQWRSEVYCPKCGIILSFLSPQINHLTYRGFSKVYFYTNFDEQIVILWTYPLYRGSEAYAFYRFEQMNE